MSPNNFRGPRFVGRPLIYFITAAETLGLLLLGLEQGAMSGIILNQYFVQRFNDPSPAEIGTLVAILELGALASSLLARRISDSAGRRRTLLHASLLLVIGNAIQACTIINLPVMIIGRFISGLGLGALSAIVPIYHKETWSSPSSKGRRVCMDFTNKVSGYAMGVWLVFASSSFMESDVAWRLPLLCQLIMAVLLWATVYIMPESPRWLLNGDHDEEGILVLAALFGAGDVRNTEVREVFREMKMEVLLQRQEGEFSYSHNTLRRYAARLFIAISAQALAQLNGLNLVTRYSPLLLRVAGWTDRSALFMSGINAIVYLLATFPQWYLVDRSGRRPALMFGSLVMVMPMSVLSYFNSMAMVEAATTAQVSLISIMVFATALGLSWGPIPQLYPDEILPLNIRAKGAELSTAAGWICSSMTAQIIPILLLLSYLDWLCLVHICFCILSFLLVNSFYQETTGIRLEDMKSIFGDHTSGMNTPVSQPERSVNISWGSPTPSLDIRLPCPDSAIPGLEIESPPVLLCLGSEQQPATPTAQTTASSASDHVSEFMASLLSQLDEAETEPRVIFGTDEDLSSSVRA